MSDVQNLIEAWKPYVDSITDWQELVTEVIPKDTTCGPVYELRNPIERPNESFAVSDMRNLSFAEPHHHKNGETEVYFVVQGSGLAVIGGEELHITKASVVVIPPEISHFTIPEDNLVLAVVNTPPFSAENVVVDVETNERVGFHKEQLMKLVEG